MSFEFPRAMPSLPPGIRGVEMGPENIVGVSRSPFTLQAQYQERPGKRWVAKVTLPPLKDADTIDEWIAFLLSLQGPVQPFLMGDFLRSTPRGVVDSASTPVLDGDSQSGGTIATRGWKASTSGLLVRGDYIQIGGGRMARLHRVLADVDSDAAGEADIEIWPPIQSDTLSPAEKLTDGGLEVWTDANNLTSWVESYTATCTYSRETSPYAGTYCCGMLRASGANMHVIEQSGITLAAGMPYRLRYALKMASVQASALRLYLGNTSGLRSLVLAASGGGLIDRGAWLSAAYPYTEEVAWQNGTASWVLHESGFFVDREFAAADLNDFRLSVGIATVGVQGYLDALSIYGPSYDGMPIYTSSPVGCFRLAESTWPWSADHLRVYGLSLSAVSDV